MRSLFAAMNPRKWLQSHIIYARSGRHATKRKARYRLALELLERRDVPSASISIAGASAIEESSTLKSLGHFVSDGSGGLARARGSVFGPDGNFYVASADTNAILRYDRSGEFINTFCSVWHRRGPEQPWSIWRLEA